MSPSTSTARKAAAAPLLAAAIVTLAGAPLRGGERPTYTPEMQELQAPLLLGERGDAWSMFSDHARPTAGARDVLSEPQEALAPPSLDLGDETYNEEVRRPEWFNSASHPNATFMSTSIEAAGGCAFEATGELTIKGITQTITVPITVGQVSGQQTFDGTLEVSRKAFGIGEPMWDEVLEDKVAIRFHLVSSNP